MQKQPSPEGCFFSYIRGFAADYIFLSLGQKAKVCAPLCAANEACLRHMKHACGV